MARQDTVDLRPHKEFVRKECDEVHPFSKAVELLPDSEPREEFVGQLRILIPLARMK